MDSFSQAMGITSQYDCQQYITSINLPTINSLPFAFMCIPCLVNKFLSDNILIS